MNKIIVILFLLIGLSGYGQISPKHSCTVPDTTEQFGINLPTGSLIFNLGDSCLYSLLAPAISTDKLSISEWIIIGSNIIIDHGTTTGLTDDDHTQYALLAGRSGDTLHIDQIEPYDVWGRVKMPALSLSNVDNLGELYFGDGNFKISYSLGNVYFWRDYMGRFQFHNGVNDLYWDTQGLHANGVSNVYLGHSYYPWWKFYSTNITDDSTNIKLKVPVGAYDSLLVINGTAIYKKLSTYEPILTKGNLTESITGLQFDNTRQVIGGAADLSLTATYFLPNYADTLRWYNKWRSDIHDSIPIFTSGVKGIVPASGGGTANYMRADGTWTAPPGSGGTVTGTGTTNYVTKFTGTSSIGNSIIFDNGTNVGIGTTSPSYKLDVNGSINFPTTSSTTGMIYQNGAKLINTFAPSGSIGSNLFIGNSGNFTMTYASGNNSSLNLGIGDGTLNSITIGYRNTAIGFNAGNLISTGNYNNLVGAYAGNRITTGIQNNFQGWYAGGAVTTGNYNVALGESSLRYVQTGNYNTALGYRSLFSTAGTTALDNSIGVGAHSGKYETGSNKLFIDGLDRANEATGRINSLIYGVMNATPASQILSLGGGGNVGIGTTTPDSTLTVTGSGRFSTNLKVGGISRLIGKVQVGQDKSPAYALDVTGEGYFSDDLWVNDTARFTGSGNILTSGNGNLNINVGTGAVVITGDLTVTGAMKSGTGTIADNDETPSVAGFNTFVYAGSANSVTITDLDDPVIGAYYTIIGNSNDYIIIIEDTGNFKLNKVGACTLYLDDVIVLYCMADDYYIEISRSDN